MSLSFADALVSMLYRHQILRYLATEDMQHTDIAVADVVISVVLGNDDTVAVTEFSPCRLFRRQRVDFVL